MRKYLFFTMLLAMTLITAACGNKSSQAETATTGTPKVKIVATIYPVYEFARQVGGDKVDVSILIPPGAEPHEWEPTAKDLIKIKSASLFLYNGAGFEPVHKLLTKEVLGSAIPVEVSQGIPLITSSGHDDHNHGHNQGREAEVDPHVWLDPEFAKVEVDTITAALSKVDQANQEFYRQNANRYKAELTKLHEDYTAALSTLTRRDIVTTHAAFQYLAKRYNLNQIPIMGLAPDAEPTPDKLAAIVKFCREKQVTTIFFETLVSPRVAQTIAKETGAKLLVLNPADGLTDEDFKKGKNYLTIMRENLENLKIALQ